MTRTARTQERAPRGGPGMARSDHDLDAAPRRRLEPSDDGGRSGGTRATGTTPLHVDEHSRDREDQVYDQFDVTLEDVDLLGEVELTTNLIIAASETDERLSTAEIDRILGVTPAQG